jgi:hypothetical protein
MTNIFSIVEWIDYIISGYISFEVIIISFKYYDSNADYLFCQVLIVQEYILLFLNNNINHKSITDDD